MRLTTLCLAAFMSVSLHSSALAISPEAQDKTSTAAAASVENPNLSPEKKALILDLLKITEADKTVDKVVAQMMAAHQKQYPLMIAAIVNADTSLTDDQKKDLIEKSQARSLRSSERLRELFVQKINLGDVLNKVALVVYDKNFTDAELKDIIAFYKTPTGQKSLKQMPEVMRESMEMTTTLISPQMNDIITQLMTEEKARLKTADKPDDGKTTQTK
ncbi:MAG: DUF2059 domain-containing protein [Candidatus Melainabacteria bacterium]|nr:MAG: DUF2059 domain-containing protein [Candidatus Melainabacteria bacterium]